ncbi:MAG: TraR/DksA C4-type zinc finger protein [Thermodesulfobacteriota bacterium]
MRDEATSERRRLGRELRQVLLARRAELIGHKLRVEHDLSVLESESEPELVERGQDETMARLLRRLDDQERVEIEAIDRALGKIAADAYGVCEACHARIDVARLRAIPWASTCLSCASTSSRAERTHRFAQRHA